MSKLEKLTTLHDMAKKMAIVVKEMQSAPEHNYAIASGGLVIGKVAEELGLEPQHGPLALTIMLDNPDIGLNAFIRAFKAFEDGGCGMCPACIQKGQQKAPKGTGEEELKEFLANLFGEDIQIHVVQINKGPTKH